MLRSNYANYVPPTPDDVDDSVFFGTGVEKQSLRAIQKHNEVSSDLYTLSSYVKSGVNLQDVSSQFGDHRPSMEEREYIQTGVDLLSNSQIETE